MLACIIDVFRNCERGNTLCVEPSPELFEILKRGFTFFGTLEAGLVG